MSTTVIIAPRRKSKHPKTATHQSLATGRYYKFGAVKHGNRNMARVLVTVSSTVTSSYWIASGFSNIDLLNPRTFKTL